MIKHLKVLLLITVLCAAGTISCDMDYDKQDPIPADALMIGGGMHLDHAH